MDPTNIAPVGTAALGVALWDTLDLAGELRQWNLDYYAPSYFPCTDCACLDPVRCLAAGQAAAGDGLPLRILRSASFFARSELTLLEPTNRLAGEAPGLFYHVGFRCARSP
jgi:formylglycine-generating enzyme required for sulfatase activity